MLTPLEKYIAQRIATEVLMERLNRIAALAARGPQSLAEITALATLVRQR